MEEVEVMMDRPHGYVQIRRTTLLGHAQQRGRTGRGWDQAYLDEQHRRLDHARQNCNFYLATDQLTEVQVLQRVIDFLQQ